MIAGQLDLLDLAEPGAGQAEMAERYGPSDAPGVTPIVTSGRIEYSAVCPGCAAVHRHTTPGVKSAPCGAYYTIPATTKESADA